MLPSSINAQINEWHSDCKYVVNGTSHSEAFRKFCKGNNADVWSSLSGYLSSGPAATKVAAHRSLSQCRSQEELKHWYGNLLADISAGYVTERLRPPGFVLEVIENNRSLAFDILRRIAAIEQLVAKYLIDNRFSSALNPAVPLVEPSSYASDAINSLGDHKLVRLGKWLRCSRCQERRPLSKWACWSRVPCVDPQAAKRTTSPNVSTSTPVPEVFYGNRDETTKARKSRADVNCEARGLNRKAKASGQSAALRALPTSTPSASSCGPREHGGAPPSWIHELCLSHSLRYAGGAVWCSACGSQARALRKGLPLLTSCEGRSPSWKSSDGRITRPLKLSSGSCQQIFNAWPDGRPDTTLLNVRSFSGVG